MPFSKTGADGSRGTPFGGKPRTPGCTRGDAGACGGRFLSGEGARPGRFGGSGEFARKAGEGERFPMAGEAARAGGFIACRTRGCSSGGGAHAGGTSAELPWFFLSMARI